MRSTSINLNYLNDVDLLQTVERMTQESDQQKLKKIFSFSPETRLKDLGLNRENIDNVLDRLNEHFNISIKGVDREEIIVVQDLITAVYLQLR